ncbi:MAG: DUF370 domain-containing protein [Clostridia bacterium]|nr:DUF370 domain-containing protein [Clostridia bacterium]
MYVHAGNNRIIRTRDIIGIFDMDTATMGTSTREYLRSAEKENRMINIKEEIPKSFIVTSDKEKIDKVYVSQISTSALLGRINSEVKE